MNKMLYIVLLSISTFIFTQQLKANEQPVSLVPLYSLNVEPSESMDILSEKIKKLQAEMTTMRKRIASISQELRKDYWTYRGVKKKVQQTMDRQQQIIDALQLKLKENQQGLNQTIITLDDKIKQSTTSQQQVISDLQNKVDGSKKVISDLQATVDNTKKEITDTSTKLDSKIQQTSEQTNTKLASLDSNLEKTRLYWLVGLLTTLLLGVFAYLFLGKRIKSSKTDVEIQIRNTKKSLEEESVKLDHKLIEVLEKQLKLQQEEKQSLSTLSSSENDTTDHSLALKVADEIVRMQKNIARMDEKTKGLKPLIKGMERIQSNFAANGYEMVQLLGKDYEDRMNIDVINFLDDDSLDDGKKIITKVIKPQINYNGLLIQRAQVEVSQN